MNNHYRKSIIVLALAVMLVFTNTVPALAAALMKKIDVFTGVNIYVDDHFLQASDANGNPVEAFIYNGTTYLPVRAVSEALDIPVHWEGKSKSVYIGKHNGSAPAFWLTELDYYSKQSTFSFADGIEDSFGTVYNHCIFETRNDVWYTYNINGQYTAISGTFFQNGNYRDDSAKTTLKIYGDGELLYYATTCGGQNPIDPQDFYVDLTGVLQLKVELIYDVWGSHGIIGDCGLWT